ncbi:MAG: ATP-binding protein [Desulfobacteraceae bacterium]|jgi:tRNA(Ile)-lysidine synthase TilS/MesJ
MNSAIGYSAWKAEHESILQSFPRRNVLLLYSGGKDSSVAMDFVSKAATEFGFGFEAHAGAYPNHRYTDEEIERLASYWRKRGVEITWHDMGETDDYIKYAVNPCISCQKLRKQMLKTSLMSTIKDWESLVLITCYSLWDVVSYSLERVLSGRFSNFDKGDNDEKNRRFKETAQRFYPLLNMNEGYTIFRPLIKYNNADILNLIAKEQIPILSIPCEFSDFRPKRILEKYYAKMGMSFEYEKVFDFARSSLSLPNLSVYTSMRKEEYLLEVF